MEHAERDWPPVDLAGYLEAQRRLIVIDRQLYKKFKQYLIPRYIEIWPVVENTLKVRARFYRGEMLRAKRDTERFILGEDPAAPRRYEQELCADVSRLLGDLPAEIEEAYSADSSSLGKLSGSLLDMSLQAITKVTDELERTTYGG